MPRIRPYLFAGVSLLLALVVACGGSKDSGSHAAANGAVVSDNGSGPIAGLQKVSLTESTAKLQDLQSFRFSLRLKLDLSHVTVATSNGDVDALMTELLSAFSDIAAEGAYVAPDQAQVSLNFGGQEFGYVRIGDQAWENLGDGWQVSDSNSGMFDISAGPSSAFGGLLPEEAIDVASTSREKVNGIETTHYSFDKDALKRLATQVGDEIGSFSDADKVNVDIWLTDDGIPVRLKLDISGKDDNGQPVSLSAELNISDINSNSIQIKRPS